MTSSNIHGDTVATTQATGSELWSCDSAVLDALMALFGPLGTSVASKFSLDDRYEISISVRRLAGAIERIEVRA